jgi:hypothetical protein
VRKFGIAAWRPGLTTPPNAAEVNSLPSTAGAASANAQDLMPPYSRGIRVKKEEVPMFEMINEEKPSAERRKILLTKAGIFLVAIVLVAGVIYFLAFSGPK